MYNVTIISTVAALKSKQRKASRSATLQPPAKAGQRHNQLRSEIRAMLSSAAAPPFATPHYRRLAVAASATALCMSALLLIALRPQLAPSSRLSASHFFGGVDPQLAGLMSPALVAREDAAELRLSPVSSSPRRPDSTSFYGDISRRLAHLMRQRSVLAEDAAELEPSPATVASGAATGALPYDEAAVLGTSISAAAFQRIAAAASAPLARGPAPVCHACVRAAAAAAKAKAATAAKAAVARAAQERLQDAWQKQRADAASAAEKIAGQRALIAKLQVSTQLLISDFPALLSCRATLPFLAQPCSR
jgi:hypothetical protein